MTTAANRRKFLQMVGAGAAATALPGSITKALAVPANHRTGTLADVEHIVILTQENRSFDHYFGTMRGVRGFGDPRAVTLPNGKSVLRQPDGSGGEVLPFRPDVANMGAVFLEDVSHGWGSGHGAWNLGNYDQWVPNKGIAAMTYLTRQDLPYHYALADAFTVCDAYYCSLMGPTDPNRYHLWTGWCGNDGKGGGPVVDNAEAGYDWSSYPERLQRNGISWKIYQDIGLGLDAANYWGWGPPYIGNYGDNSLLYLHQYQNARPGNPLADFAKTGTDVKSGGTLFDQFRQDVQSDRLPQVSWIAGPETYTEHPNWCPNFGAWYISQFIDILASNPEVMSKTVLFINYDENGGFFDHMVSPTPPAGPSLGKSTVDIVNEIFPGSASYASGPYGLGVRVPMMIVSPWTKGGWVNSQVFDHTSLIRFIEARFADGNPDLIESNITPWRRAVAGDLTSAFDFRRPDGRRVTLPVTAGFMPPDQNLYPDFVPVLPTDPSLPVQEPGTRPARALPYQLEVHGSLRDGTLRLSLDNLGEATAVIQVRSGLGDTPRSYTVGPGRHLSDTWGVADGYDLAACGPNGFLRAFKGGSPGDGTARLDIRSSYGEEGGISLHVTNQGSRAVFVKITDNYSGDAVERRVGPHESLPEHWSLANTHGWYDLTVTAAEDAGFQWQLAGHVETGRDSISDPALGARAD